MQGDYQTKDLSPELTADLEIMACMQDLLRRVQIPDLKKRWSNRTIMYAFLTHASAGIRALIETGEYTPGEAEAICRDFTTRVMAASRKTRLKGIVQ